MPKKNELKHIGIIMDGNRRWAKSHGLAQQVVEGHRAGSKRFIDLCLWCIDENIPCVTVFAFSTENWNRSEEEVQGIFKLMEYFFETEIENCIKKGIRLRILGDRTRLSEKSQKIIADAETRTKDCDKLNAQIAINYGGRDEIFRAVKKLYAKIQNGAAVSLEKMSEKDFESVFEECLDTAGLPQIDLVIRTGADGRKRTSGFLPWQTVYSELYFLDTLWPDFSKDDLKNAVNWFYGVERNMGA
ncbi:MAG: di-trans,poly-cis-decaprenylcistransferase [Treponema sp.]|jgi:undecaprenyl diphosphate synthase|nr:di-trans,poly-cis-decaprenylcistransferase [Treponema sp.]